MEDQNWKCQKSLENLNKNEAQLLRVVLYLQSKHGELLRSFWPTQQHILCDLPSNKYVLAEKEKKWCFFRLGIEVKPFTYSPTRLFQALGQWRPSKKRAGDERGLVEKTRKPRPLLFTSRSSLIPFVVGPRFRSSPLTERAWNRRQRGQDNRPQP